MAMLGPLAAGGMYDGVGSAAPYWLSVGAMLAAPAQARVAVEA